ncbi:MAG: gluconate 2-dehydrogenase subunit 3 family protein [Bacteroidota bacterium]
MNRREAIYNFVILSAGAAVLPSCAGEETATIALKNFSLTGAQETMIRRLSDFILPKTRFQGSGDIKATEFTLMMVDECYPPERQKVFTDGMEEFEKLSKEKFGGSFVSSSDAQKKDMLTFIEAKKDVPENVAKFYETTKRHTVQAMTSSQKYLTDVVGYKMVPGSNFKGCVPVAKS